MVWVGEMIAPVKLYQPSSGTEGGGFFANWCDQCARDLPSNGTKAFDECEPHEICEIIELSMAYMPSDPEYPNQWRYVDGKPTCTAFVPIGSPLPTPAELESAGQERLPL